MGPNSQNWHYFEDPIRYEVNLFLIKKKNHQQKLISDMASAVLIGCLATLGVIIAILLLLAGGYLWWRHKRSQLQFIEPNEDEESSNGSMR